MSKETKDVPLRVRVTLAEDARILEASEKHGLAKSTYVRWALENSNTQVLGTTIDGVSALKPVVKKALKPKPEPALELIVLPAEFEHFIGDGCGIDHEAPLEALAEPVPDLLTAMGLVQPGDPQPATFDDASWE